MTRYNTLNVKLFNPQLNNLKFAMKYATEVTLKLLSNFTGNSNNDTNFAHELLLTNISLKKL